MPKVEYIERNVELARNFSPMPEGERRRLRETIAAERKISMRQFFRRHEDA